jgi:hypothetical protein
MIYLLTIIITFGAVFVALTSNIQSTTKWLGNKIADDKIIRTTPHAFASPLEVQTMISSSYQSASFFGEVLLYALVAVLGYSIKWWAALLALIALALMAKIVRAVFLPRGLSYWIKWVSVGVQNRIADYRKRNDHDRAESLAEFIPILAEHEQFAESQSLDILDT